MITSVTVLKYIYPKNIQSFLEKQLIPGLKWEMLQDKHGTFVISESKEAETIRLKE